MNKHAQSGFTLIEVMIVVSIVGILAVMAAPFYHDYVVRAEVSEGLTMASASTAAVAEVYMEDGLWPADNAEAGISDPDSIRGKYVSRVEVIDGTLAVTFGGDVNEAIRGKTLGLEPTVNDEGDVVWVCGTHSMPGNAVAKASMDMGGSQDVTTLPNKYLPESCRS